MTNSNRELYYPERGLIAAILWACHRRDRTDAEWVWNDLAEMARNMRKLNDEVTKAASPTTPLSASAELKLIGWILNSRRLQALKGGKAHRQSVARAVQVVWHQCPDIAIFASRIDRLRIAARTHGTRLADELVREARRKIYRHPGFRTGSRKGYAS